MLTAIGLLAIALIGSWAIVRLYGPAFTRERVEALLGEALGQPVRVGAVRLRPLLGRVSLQQLQIDARPGSPDDLQARAVAIDVSLDIASLWRRQLTVWWHRRRGEADETTATDVEAARNAEKRQ